MERTVICLLTYMCFITIESRYAHVELDDDALIGNLDLSDPAGQKRHHEVELQYNEENYFYDIMYDLATCGGLSEEHGCTNCTNEGHCYRGYLPVDPWLNFALKTQRDMQIDKTFDHIMMFDMRFAHLPTDNAIGCMEYHRLYEDGIREIGEWLDIPENKGELIRLIISVQQGQGYDSEINDPIALFFGDKVITPKEYNETYNYQWPTMRQMRKDGKNLMIVSAGLNTHGDHFIHKMFWENSKVKEFTDYPDCGGKTIENLLRFYSDSNKYGRAYDGTKQTGTILDFTEYVKCNIQYPARDQINPEMMKTGVFTWAEGQPSDELTAESCVILDGTEKRWYVASSCTEEQFFACQYTDNPHDWMLSTSEGPFNVKEAYCPDGYNFSIPHDGFEQQKLVEAANGVTVWLDYTPWLPGYSPPSSTSSPIEPTTETASSTAPSSAMIIATIILIFGTFNIT
ncbi:uncharacterized protein [Amphiura filiformis]|uniref:uncharacterized protein n=1 Tax=Amphiura filiformis TaxID=82378 RepID=UPI003B217C9B